MAVAFSRDGGRVLAAAGRSVWSWDVTGGTYRGKLPHSSLVTALAVSPDNRQLLTGCVDHTAHLWDTSTGLLLGTPLLTPSPVWSVAFHPRKPLLVTGSGRESTTTHPQDYGHGAVQLWDAATHQPVGPPLAEGGLVHAVAFSPDGRFVLTATKDGQPRRADLSRLSCLASTIRHSPQVRGVSFSPDGRSLLTVAPTGGREPAEGEIRLWDAATGRAVAGPMPARKEGTEGPTFRIAFSPDGKAVRMRLGYDHWLARDAATGGLLGPPLPEKGPPCYPLEFRPDGKQFYVLRDGALLLWDVAANRQVGSPVAHEGGVTAAAFHPDGTTLLTAGGDGTTRRWDLATHCPVGEPVRHPSPVRALAFAPDGRTFATADQEDRLRRWETETGQPLGSPWHDPDKKPREHYHGLSFTPDGSHLVVDSHEALRLWETATGRLVVTLPNLGFAWAADGKWLALIPGDPYKDKAEGVAVRIWDMDRRKRHGLAGTASNDHSLDFHPGSRIVATTGDRAAGLWDVATGKPIGPPLEHPGTVSALHFAPDGRRLATCCVDDLARIWEVPRPVQGEPEVIRLWVEVLTGQELDEAGDARPLPREEQEQRRRRLAELGGPPVS
jgi:WD40 repeat protein